MSFFLLWVRLIPFREYRRIWHPNGCIQFYIFYSVSYHDSICSVTVLKKKAHRSPNYGTIISNINNINKVIIIIIFIFNNIIINVVNIDIMVFFVFVAVVASDDCVKETTNTLRKTRKYYIRFSYLLNPIRFRSVTLLPSKWIQLVAFNTRINYYIIKSKTNRIRKWIIIECNKGM